MKKIAMIGMIAGLVFALTAGAQDQRIKEWAEANGLGLFSRSQGEIK